jgi:hypothetical protein
VVWKASPPPCFGLDMGRLLVAHPDGATGVEGW